MILRKIASAAAILVLLAACETAPTEKSGASGAGASSAASSSAGSSPTMPAPSQVTLGSSQDFVLNVGDRVFFQFDKSSLGEEARTVLEKQAAWLKRYAGYEAIIEGHADERGTREYNLALGDRRANAVKDFLVALGLNPKRIVPISYGKERPVALGHNDAAWGQNRRGVTVLRGRPSS